MKLSEKANSYINTLKRDEAFTLTNRTDIETYIESQGIPAFPEVVAFQMDFSGFELAVFGESGSTFKAGLFSKSDLEIHRPIDPLNVGGKLYFYCGDHATAQFWFVIGENGAICTYDNGDETVNVIFSSFTKLVETYTLIDLLNRSKKYKDPYSYTVIDNSRFDSLTHDFPHSITASDVYNKWLFSEHLIIQKGVRYDEPVFFIRVYSDAADYCRDFIRFLQSEQVIA